MFGQVGRFCKPFVTPFKLALERFLACVNTSMNRQCARNGKLASTSWFGAFERFLARVRSHVLSHNVRLRESLLAQLTLIGLISCMCLDMSHRLLSLSKSTSVSFTALPLADILALAHPNMIFAQVISQRVIVQEHLATSNPSTIVLIIQGITFLFLFLLLLLQCLSRNSRDFGWLLLL